MPINVTCPECQSTYRVADEAAGKAIKCKKCGARVPVSTGGEESAAEAGAAAQPTKKGGSSKMLLIVGGVALLFGCCCVLPGGGGFLGWYMGWFGGFVTVKDGFKDIVKDGPKDLAKMKDGGAKAGGGITILEKKETLTTKDPAVNGKPAKDYKVKLEQGKSYVITLRADVRTDFNKPPDFKNPPHDPVLRLLDSAGQQVGWNDDFEPGTSLDSQIRYTAAKAGEYTVQATCLIAVPQGGMPFTLTVKQE
jgi:predicted Zn finger-like uncharacterized protein